MSAPLYNFYALTCTCMCSQAGPSGAMFGMLACQIVDLVYCWHYLTNPLPVLIKYMLIVGFFFLAGLLPWIDNWSHLFGAHSLYALFVLSCTVLSISKYYRYRSVCDLYLCAGFVIGLLLAFALYPWATLPDDYLQRLGEMAKQRMRRRGADEADSAESLIRFGHRLFRWLLIIGSLGITIGIGVILYV